MLLSISWFVLVASFVLFLFTVFHVMHTRCCSHSHKSQHKLQQIKMMTLVAAPSSEQISKLERIHDATTTISSDLIVEYFSFNWSSLFHGLMFHVQRSFGWYFIVKCLDWCGIVNYGTMVYIVNYFRHHFDDTKWFEAWNQPNRQPKKILLMLSNLLSVCLLCVLLKNSNSFRQMI